MKRISDYLETGNHNAIQGRILCSILNCTLRELQAAVERERRAGYPICASSGSNPGYFLAADQEELQRHCDSLRHRAGALHKTRRALLNLIDTLPPGKEPPTSNGMEVGKNSGSHT